MFVIICTVNGLYMHVDGLLWAVGMLSDAVVTVVEEATALAFAGASYKSQEVEV